MTATDATTRNAHRPTVGKWVLHPRLHRYGLIHAVSSDANRVAVLWEGGNTQLRDIAGVQLASPDPTATMGLASQVIAHLARKLDQANARATAAQDRAGAAVVEVDQLRQRARAAEQLAAQRGVQLENQTDHHQQTLEAIRDYAIERHRAGDICRDGLESFLANFDMPPLEAQYHVTFTVMFTVTAADEDSAYDLAHADMDRAARARRAAHVLRPRHHPTHL